MNKKFLSAILFGVLMVTSTGTFVSCKDYDDDIDELNKKVEANQTAIAELQSKINSGEWVDEVTSTANGIIVKLGNGTEYPITNGTNGTNGAAGVSPKIIVEDGYIKVSHDNGATYTNLIALSDLKGEPGTSGSTVTPKFSVGEDGHLYVQYGEDETTKKDLGLNVNGIFYVEKEATVEIYMPKKTGATTAYDTLILPKVVGYVTSLVHNPNIISPKFGDIIFFPVIATDYGKIAKEADKTYTFDVLNESQYATIYKGWADVEYTVNPNSVADYTTVGFLNRQVAVTRAVSKNITFEATPEKGILAVSAQGFDFVNNDNKYDDPNGDKADNRYAEEADMIAFQVKNKNADENIVTSDYATAKRLVVEQRNINIEFIEDEDDDAVEIQKLHGFTIDNLSTEAKTNAFLTGIEPNLKVSFATPSSKPLHLKPLLESCVEQFYTNISDDVNKGHATLAELGFKNLSLEFAAVNYKNAEVQQTKDYLELTGDAVSFDQNNTAAGYREPVIKVSLYGEENGSKLLITEKLLKIQVVSVLQGDLVENEAVGPWTLHCATAEGTVGGVMTYSAVNMDKYFNLCKFDKNMFLSTYGTPAVTFTKDGVAYTTGDITVDGTMRVNATDGQNYLKFGIKSTVAAGAYVAKIVYTVATGNTSAPYKTITINAAFNVVYPANGPLVANTNMWNSDKQMEIRPADYTTGKAEYKGIIENGFNDFTEVLSSCPEAEATLHFDVYEKATQKVNDVLVSSVVTIEKDATGKHVITLAHNTDGKNLVNKAVRLRAWVTFNDATANHAKNADVKVDLTNSHIFEVKFVKPINTKNEDMSSKLWLVDLKDELAVSLSSFFDIYNFQGTTNGMIWDNIEGWKSTTLRGYNEVKVTYALADNQPNLNKERVVLDSATGTVQWKKSQSNPGETVPEGNVQPIKFVATVAHYWGVEKVEITVDVKDATKAVPATTDIKHIPDGTKY